MVFLLDILGAFLFDIYRLLVFFGGIPDAKRMRDLLGGHAELCHMLELLVEGHFVPINKKYLVRKCCIYFGLIN